jgi:superfamily II DNA or RNA helicase
MPRSLASALSQSFTRNARLKGEQYFFGGRVARSGTSGNVFSATVRGTYDYDVTLTLDGARLVVLCDCPYFIDVGQGCKHIWAAILAADDTRALAPPPGVWLDADSGLHGAVADHEQQAVAPVPPAGYGVPRQPPLARQPLLARQPERPPAPAKPPEWRTFLAGVTAAAPLTPAQALPRGELLYVLDPTIRAHGLTIELLTRERKKSGDWGKPKPLVVDRFAVRRLPDPRDRELLETIAGGESTSAYSAPAWSHYHVGSAVPSVVVLNETLQRELARKLCETGRLMLRGAAGADKTRSSFVPVEWEPAPATFRLRVVRESDGAYMVDGRIETDEGERPLHDALILTAALVLWTPAAPDGRPRLAPFHPGRAERWIASLSARPVVTVPATEADVLAEAMATTDPALVDCPDELRVDTRFVPPQPLLRITRGTRGGYWHSADRLDAALKFVYGDLEVDPWFDTPVVFDRPSRTAFRRDVAAERDAIARLPPLGVRMMADWEGGGTRMDLAESSLSPLVRVLMTDGWRIEAEGRVYRSPTASTLDVRSGIDWFELHGRIDFGGVTAELPALLAAVRRRERFVRLSDGSMGLLPEEWLANTNRLAAIGSVETDHLRFAKAQAPLLDAWLATQPAVSCDEAFATARRALAEFERVQPVEPPRSFRGVLRPYQRDALAWFGFLRQFGFGGCLADEMGLGKTVMVLAALDARRLERERAGQKPHPSLIVVPRSVVFNWRLEASRFAPKLRVLDYTGSGRRDLRDRIDAFDIVLTTYGTLRLDIGDLKAIAFDYAILDEAQAIKNADTASAKAARLLQANHRLALSGTPVENHLGELWSLFEFLNPGALGSASLAGAAGSRGGDDGMLDIVARAVRPFILRRTKEQVASDLPARTEQTIYCDLEPPQRSLYNELRDHYRAALLGRVERDGLGRSKLQILEALLRLRQAACHPGLIDRDRAGAASAKLDVLVPRLQELVEDGRKVLIFSQFTTLLGLLRPRLDDVGLRYEYLDGRTRDRQARVQRFQETDCPLFLISLKAGGLGLNLTAAEYVFLLDPWWNPAVEAQAIDRAHRIGQRRPVFAFRLIARDTVEEKVLELQASKRKLADAIVRADASLIRDLKREDLELLLG